MSVRGPQSIEFAETQEADFTEQAQELTLGQRDRGPSRAPASAPLLIESSSLQALGAGAQTGGLEIEPLKPSYPEQE